CTSFALFIHTSLAIAYLVPATTSFVFSATAAARIYTLSLHDALPISYFERIPTGFFAGKFDPKTPIKVDEALIDQHIKKVEPHSDRKSTRLNSSHLVISYAVFCLKKKTVHRS